MMLGNENTLECALRNLWIIWISIELKTGVQYKERLQRLSKIIYTFCVSDTNCANWLCASSVSGRGIHVARLGSCVRLSLEAARKCDVDCL